MQSETYLSRLKEGIISLDFEGVHQAAKEAMDAGEDAIHVIMDTMAPAMEVVGEKFDTGEYFLSELVVAAAVMREGMDIIIPHIRTDSRKTGGGMVIATVEGDHHDIGKRLVVSLLEAQAIEVIDLGVDVSADHIVDAVKKQHATVVGLSALLTTTLLHMGDVIKRLEAADLRKAVKVIIGGAAVTPEFGKMIGADHTALNAIEGTHKCAEWLSASSEMEVI